MINISFWNIAFTVINLLILFVAFRIFFFKPIKKVIEKRQQEADEIFAKAKAADDQAAEIKKEYEDKLVSAEAEKKQIVSDARKQADKEYQSILENAKTEAQSIHDVAVAEAEHEQKEIIGAAKREIAQMVIDATAKVVGTQTGADIDSELFDKFINEAGE